MASKSLDDLVPVLKEKALLTIELCRDQGFELLIYCTYRSLEEQAQLFRQGRTIYDIRLKMDKLTKMGYKCLADIIEKVGPQKSNNIVTNAGPGESYHNYHLAFDAVPLSNGKALWDDMKKFKIYGKIVTSLGLNWSGNWKSFKEYPHAQLSNSTNPFKEFSPEKIKQILNL